MVGIGIYITQRMRDWENRKTVDLEIGEVDKLQCNCNNSPAFFFYNFLLNVYQSKFPQESMLHQNIFEM